MRPIHIVAYDEQPGCTIQSATLGPTEPNLDGTPGVTSSVYYGVELDGKTILKWANDQGYTGVVQVGMCPQARCTGVYIHKLLHYSFPALNRLLVAILLVNGHQYLE